MIYFVRLPEVNLTILSLEARGAYGYKKESIESIDFSTKTYNCFKRTGIVHC
jgi:hypothetical protein